MDDSSFVLEVAAKILFKNGKYKKYCENFKTNNYEQAFYNAKISPKLSQVCVFANNEMHLVDIESSSGKVILTYYDQKQPALISLFY